MLARITITASLLAVCTCAMEWIICSNSSDDVLPLTCVGAGVSEQETWLPLGLAAVRSLPRDKETLP